MKLKEALDQIDSLTDDDVIFAKRPWHMESEAVVTRFDADYKVSESIPAAGFSYFLEASVSKEVLEVFGVKPPSERERRDLLLHYAQYDGFPDWVYER